ncbi:DUF4118 domain-containing protein [Planctomicrobium sp. SH527]|uniref:DUF4118 domain-containing protein n=1 Tax=Planctomicrobium sp. SH527 TaxID=3448123 RepID=UPI003F5C6DAA
MIPASRPNPDQLLAQLQDAKSRETRGTLRIFFGYAAGVGKTYSMLQAARQARREGRDVIVGYVEPHERADTEALLEGFETLPLLEIPYRGVLLKEFDVDAALARHPDLILVDELAHTNAAGCRHEKRWQDVEEILEAGINVWTTLNVQHIESLNDVIGQITGVIVRETIPDGVFERADDLELIDITPEELLARLKAGKVYVSHQAERAIQSFFQKPNLTALRELSLRRAADRVHDDVEAGRHAKAAIQPWATVDRLLVCIGPSPTTARVIRTAKRMATALHASWIAVSVDLAGEESSRAVKQQIAQHFQLAERLGAETLTLAGQDVTETILDFARSRNVTKILIGKTKQPRWRRFLLGTVVDDLLEQSGEIDVYVIHGKEDIQPFSPVKSPDSHLNLSSFLKSSFAIMVAACLAAGLRLLQIADAEANTVMLFLAGVAWAAFRYGRGPAVLSSILAVLIFDFFFVPPLYTFATADSQYAVTFAVMLTIGLAISTLTSRLRAQIESARKRERRTSALFELGKQLSSLSGKIFLVNAAGSKLSEITSGEICIYLSCPSAPAELVFGGNSSIANHPVSLPTAQWVIDHEQIAGAGTNTLPNALAVFFPLIGSQRSLGAVGIRINEMQTLLEPDQRRFIEACANQLALSLERDQLAIDATEAHIQAETEQVRSSLLSSVSHDLKTPLAAIAGASSSLLQSSTYDEAVRRQLLETISEEANRLNRLLENILQMSKLDAGATTPNRQWHLLEEIVGSALRRTQQELKQHPVQLNLPDHLPLIFIDGLLLEQVFVNLLENSARYTPPGTGIHIAAVLEKDVIRINVSDNGPGIPAGAEEKIFNRFYRAFPMADSGRGSGLGLAICRAIVKAHGGTIIATNVPGGGAEFVIRLPLRKDAPQIQVE